MKKAYLIQSEGRQARGIFSNVKTIIDRIEEQDKLPHYSTIASYLSNGFPVDLGTVTIDGTRLEDVRIIRFDVNTVSLSRRI